VFAGWMLSLLSGNDSIFYPNQWLTFSQKWKRGLEHAIKDYVFCVLANSRSVKTFEEKKRKEKKEIVSRT